jgi:hypothetical protein
MSYVGKILVVVQVVLSLLFMSFAGAVFAIHQNWRTKHDNVQKQLTTADTNLRSVQEELTNARREFDAKLAQAQTEAQQAVARNATLTAQLAALQERTNNLEQQRQSQTGLAEAKASEARFRQEEAEKQRVENAKLQAKLDETAAENRELKDQMFTQEEAYRALNKRFETGLAQLAYLKRVVANAGLETDPDVVAKQHAPPPPVEGLVTKVRKNRANRVQFVELSIGSDDGLLKGNELDVVRISGNDRSDWLGKVRVVDVGPDWAVAEIILPAKNGIIQEGDNVTTKL